MRVQISATRLLSGTVGGAVKMEHLIEGAAKAGYREVAEELVPQFADLLPTSDPARCQALSAGYEFEAVRALP